MKKKVFSILTAVLMAVAMIPMTVGVVYADVPALGTSGNCGPLDGNQNPTATATYAFDADSGKLVIRGTGAIGEHVFERMSDKDKIKSVTIDEGITAIQENAFAGAIGMENLTLPKGLKTIALEAFHNCFALSAVVLPDSLEEIGEAAFYNDNIKNVDIPAGVTDFYWNAFGREPSMGSLEKITVRSENITIRQRSTDTNYKCPSTIQTAGPIGGGYDYEFAWTTKIPGRAFSEIGSGTNDSNSLESVSIPETVTEIGECAFYMAKKLQSVDLPDGLKSIGEYCFAESGITAVSIPSGVTVIPDYAFYNCKSLGSFPAFDSVTAIGHSAFRGCDSLDSIEIPASVSAIGKDAFRYCGSLSEVTIKNEDCEIADESTFQKDSKPTIKGYDDSTAQHYAEQYAYPFISEGKAPCPKGGTHDWKDMVKKATLTKHGGVYQQCSKCKKEEFVTPLAMVNHIELKQTTYTYNGKEKKPEVIVRNGFGDLLASDQYKVSYAKNVNAGTATATVTLTSKWYEGTKTLYFKINQAANTLNVKAKAKTVKVLYRKLKNKKQSLKVSKTIKFVSSGQGSRIYKISGNKKISINKTNGTISVEKGLKKGTYKVQIKIRAKGNTNFKVSDWKTVKLTIRVK